MLKQSHVLTGESMLAPQEQEMVKREIESKDGMIDRLVNKLPQGD
jgi:hypothetical protein